MLRAAARSRRAAAAARGLREAGPPAAARARGGRRAAGAAASPETDGGADNDAAAPAPAAADDKDGAAVAALLQARKVAFEAATGATRVRLGFRLEATRRQLAGVAGFSEAQIDGCFEDGTAPGRPQACRETPAGFPRGFANARARTCWLSALAQALWHDPASAPPSTRRSRRRKTLANRRRRGRRPRRLMH